MTEVEKKARINYVNDFMYEHGFCNVYNDIDVPKLYIADLLDSMREDAYKQAIEDFVKELSYRVFEDGLWNCVTDSDIDEVAEKMKAGVKND